MLPRIERVLSNWLVAGVREIGQILIAQTNGRFSLCHREDDGRADLQLFSSSNDVAELAKWDDAGQYRSLKTAPNLRHGWRLDLADLPALRRALDLFYPGRLAALAAWEVKQLATIPLRATLNRQTGMYRAAARISDDEIDELVGRFCRSSGGEPGCLRTILWTRDASGARPSLRLPADKFTAPDPIDRKGRMIPLLCQEACNLLVAEARKVVKSEG